MSWLDLLRAACERTSQRQVAAELAISPTTLSLVLNGKYQASTAAIEARARQRYGSRHDWLTALRAACERSSQARVAEKLGVSDTTLSQVLSGTYRASTLRIERRVRGVLLGETCQCPVMYDPPLHLCQQVQERKFEQIANPQYAQAWLACRGLGRFESAGPCPNFNGGPAAKEQQAKEVTS